MGSYSCTAVIPSVNPSSRSLKHYHGYADYMHKIKYHGLLQFQEVHQSTNMFCSQNKDITLKETQYSQSGAMLFKQAPYAVASWCPLKIARTFKLRMLIQSRNFLYSFHRIFFDMEHNYKTQTLQRKNWSSRVFQTAKLLFSYCLSQKTLEGYDLFRGRDGAGGGR